MKVNLQIDFNSSNGSINTAKVKLDRVQRVDFKPSLIFEWRCGEHVVVRHEGGWGDDPWYSIEGPGFDVNTELDNLNDVRETLAEWYIENFFNYVW